MENAAERQESNEVSSSDQRERITILMRLEKQVANDNREGILPADVADSYQKFIAEQSRAANDNGKKSGEHVDDAASLKMMEDFYEKASAKAKGAVKKFEGALKKAVQDGVASEKDVKFLMEELILTGEHNFNDEKVVSDMDKAVKEKVAHMKRDKAAFDKLSVHPLMDKARISSETEFLAMSVPERRKHLSKLERIANVSEWLDGEYREQIKGYLDDGVIGTKVYFGLIAQFNEDKRMRNRSNMLDALPKLMQPYEDFWEKVGSSLQGEELAHMESLRGSADIIVLRGELLKVPAQLDAKYESSLRAFESKGLFGAHTKNAYATWIRSQQSIQAKYYALDAIGTPDSPGPEMDRYVQLQADIDTLADADQKAVRSKIGQWGYTEMRAEFDRLSGGAENDDETESQKILRGLGSSTLAGDIESFGDAIEEEGSAGKRLVTRFSQIVKRDRKTKNESDDFESSLREARLERLERKREEEEGAVRESNEEAEVAAAEKVEARERSAKVIDMQAWAKNRRKGQEKSAQPEKTDDDDDIHYDDADDLIEDFTQEHDGDEVAVRQEDSLRQVTVEDEDGDDKRIASVVVDADGGDPLQGFKLEDQRSAFRHGKDEVTFETSAAGELTRNEEVAMITYLELRQKESEKAKSQQGSQRMAA